MEKDTVAAAARQLQANGDPISIRGVRRVTGYGSPRDIAAVLRQLGLLSGADPVEEPPAPAAPEEAWPPAPPPPLLQQAEAALANAATAERQARRAVEDPASPGTWDDFTRAAQARRQAQATVDRLVASQASLLAALPGARVEARRTAGELAALKAETDTRLLRKQREARHAREVLAGMLADLVNIGGDAAVPQETDA
jgi:hypothetical protein